MGGQRVSGLVWMQHVRDSSDLVSAAQVIKYRRDKFGDRTAKYVAPQTVKLVAFAIGTFMNREGVAFVSFQTLRKRIRVTPPTIRAALLVLVHADWLVVEPGRGAGNANRYIARVPHSARYYKSGCSETIS